MPAEHDVDVAFVYDRDELVWLQEFEKLLADAAFLSAVEPFDHKLLLGLAKKGWWQEAERRKEIIS